jgi:hypothetical protein
MKRENESKEIYLFLFSNNAYAPAKNNLRMVMLYEYIIYY